MSETTTRLEALIALRKTERDDEQRRHTEAMAAKVDLGLGARVVEAIGQDGALSWEIGNTTAMRRFRHKGGEYHLVVTAVLGVERVELELRHVDARFAVLAKKTGVNEISEDWLLNNLEMLATQVSERLTNPRNFS